MSSGQRQRTPAELPLMKDRPGRRRARRARRAEPEPSPATSLVSAGLKKIAGAVVRSFGDALGSFGAALQDIGNSIDPPRRSDFALMPPPLTSTLDPIAGPTQEQQVVLGFDGSSDRGAMLATIQGEMNLKPDRWVVPFSVDEPLSGIPAGTAVPANRPASSMVEMWRESPARVEAIEHNQERYRQLMNLRRGQSSTYNQTEYR